MSATATRINRNELPQMTEVAANSTHAFRFTSLTSHSLLAG
jgi:hypothetical protein